MKCLLCNMYGSSLRRWKLFICLVVGWVAILSAEGVACHVMSVYWLKANEEESGTFTNPASVCGHFYVKVRWSSAGAEGYEHWEDDWLVHIYDEVPILVASQTFPWNINGDYTGSTKEAVLCVSGLLCDTHSLVAKVRRTTSGYPDNVWKQSPPCSVECEECWDWEHVTFAPPGECPECDNDEGGCYDTVSTIAPTGSYDEWTGPAPPGGMGSCERPTKKATVAIEYDCNSTGIDIEGILDCIDAIAEGEYTLCGICVSTQNPIACIGCAIVLAGVGYECADGAPCKFIADCKKCDDYECQNYIVGDVVDWDEVDEFCYP